MGIGQLKDTEPHPAALQALEYLQKLSLRELLIYQESYSSCALSRRGNRLAEVCSETIQRLLDKEPVSDRYLLGLAWSVREMREDDKRKSGAGTL